MTFLLLDRTVPISPLMKQTQRSIVIVLWLMSNNTCRKSANSSRSVQRSVLKQFNWKPFNNRATYLRVKITLTFRNNIPKLPWMLHSIEQWTRWIFLPYYECDNIIIHICISDKSASNVMKTPVTASRRSPAVAEVVSFISCIWFHRINMEAERNTSLSPFLTEKCHRSLASLSDSPFSECRDYAIWSWPTFSVSWLIQIFP